MNTVATFKESKNAANEAKRDSVLDPLLKKLVHLAMHHARERTCHAHMRGAYIRLREAVL